MARYAIADRFGVNPLEFVAPAKDEKGSGGQGERNEVDRDDVVENLFVATGERDDRRGNSLQDDRNDRRACFGREPADAFEKESVAGHGVVDAWSGEDALAEKAERRYCDSDGDPE